MVVCRKKLKIYFIDSQISYRNPWVICPGIYYFKK